MHGTQLRALTVTGSEEFGDPCRDCSYRWTHAIGGRTPRGFNRLFIAFQNTDSLRSRPESRYPHQITADARLQTEHRSEGDVVNCATPQRVRLTLTAEFPVVMLPSLIAGNR